MTIEDSVYATVDRETVRSWVDYSITSSIDEPATFSMTLSVSGRTTTDKQRVLEDLRAMFKDGARVEIGALIGETKVPQMIGYVEHRTIRGDAESGVTFSVSGRDAGRHLKENDARIDYKKDETLADMVARVVERWSIPVITDAHSARSLATGKGKLTLGQRALIKQARSMGIPTGKLRRTMIKDADAAARPLDEYAGINVTSSGYIASDEITVSDVRRMRLRDAMPQGGERAWEFIARHCKRLGVFQRIAADGSLLLATPDYDQEPTYSFIRTFSGEGTNVLDGGEDRNSASRPTDVYVTGWSRAHQVTRDASADVLEDGPLSLDFDDDVPRRRVKAHAFDNDPLPYLVERSIKDDDSWTAEEVVRRAAREFADLRGDWQVLTFTISGHGNNGHIVYPDTVAIVDDEYTGARGLFYVRMRSLQRSLENGTVTTVELVPLGAPTPL